MAFVSHSFTFTHFFLPLIMTPFVSPLSFNLSSMGPVDLDRNLFLEGTANITGAGIQMIRGDIRSGRATLVKLLHLWDKSSGNLADFETKFSFVIESKLGRYFEGLAFFLAPENSRVASNSGGSALGLVDHDHHAATRDEGRFVAVEFDCAFSAGWPEPAYAHIGIDINTVFSNKTVPWLYDKTAEKMNDAWISYNSTSKNLRVIISSYMSNKTQISTLEYAIDLRLHLPEWVRFGFSAATRLQSDTIITVKSWDFNSKELKIENPVPNTTSPAGNKMKAGEVIGLVVGLSVFALGLILLGRYLWRKKDGMGKEDESSFDISMENEFERGCGPKKFSYGELARATDNFAEEYKLGEGGFGGVYRGFFKDLNSYVAVKRFSKGSKQGTKEYASEVMIISQLRHRNLVQIIGWCHEKGELLLVYEFLPNGSLDSHLFNETSALTWQVRNKIARGLASALLYLHEEWEQCVVHRDIKSSNIMLDSNFNAKLGDFGLARFVDHEKGTRTTIVAGTLGYMAPECAVTGRASKESDVYSFGIVLLEIACGRRPVEYRREQNQVILVQWVWGLYGDKQLLDAADPKLESEYDAREIKLLMVVGLWCAHPDSNQRPSIRQVIQVLNSEAPLPRLPQAMPVATYTYSTPTMTLPCSSSA